MVEERVADVAHDDLRALGRLVGIDEVELVDALGKAVGDGLGVTARKTLRPAPSRVALVPRFVPGGDQDKVFGVAVVEEVQGRLELGDLVARPAGMQELRRRVGHDGAGHDGVQADEVGAVLGVARRDLRLERLPGVGDEVWELRHHADAERHPGHAQRGVDVLVHFRQAAGHLVVVDLRELGEHGLPGHVGRLLDAVPNLYRYDNGSYRKRGSAERNRPLDSGMDAQRAGSRRENRDR